MQSLRSGTLQQIVRAYMTYFKKNISLELKLVFRGKHFVILVKFSAENRFCTIENLEMFSV